MEEKYQCTDCGCTHLKEDAEELKKHLKEIENWFTNMQPYMTIPDWKKQRELLDKIKESLPVGLIKESNVTA